ncbi:MAG: AAA family ATPase [Chloroflexi bacterium]|nr:AAA family ATPase [Chloroflexota bacterium]
MESQAGFDVLWLNGAFGVGKSTVAELLRRRLRDAIVVDPESIGHYLRLTVPPDAQTQDFQDMPPWRTITRVVIESIATTYGRPVIVPMTLVAPVYFDEIIGRLRTGGVDVRHVTLRAPRETILERLAGRADTTDWSFHQVDRCIEGLDDERFAPWIDTGGRSPRDVDDVVLRSHARN